ncbi:hypothetical protein CEXT_254551 [Caerostris extrusa]|uniref:Uncharacterized protein n=1 Tax=Caerostris extrusa TaxID=172846 RepID=A0AAV4SVW7_CAEEX|nr:hypothetical protein CEXT_254551 [Caerostris extrusa]
MVAASHRSHRKIHFHRRVATVSTSDDLSIPDRNPRWLTPGPSIRGIDTQRHIGAQENQLRLCMSRVTREQGFCGN